MSRPARVAQQPPVQEPDEEEDEDDFGEDDDGDMEEGMDMFEALGGLLSTEDGDTIATSLASLNTATERIALNLEMQNKILVKILSAISKLAPTPVVVAPDAAETA
jgi:hypothetical protein